MGGLLERRFLHPSGTRGPTADLAVPVSEPRSGPNGQCNATHREACRLLFAIGDAGYACR